MSDVFFWGLVAVFVILLFVIVFMKGAIWERKMFFKGETIYWLIEYENGNRKWIDSFDKPDVNYKIIKELKTKE